MSELLQRYAAPVPRYTSYPTAPHFHEGIGAADYAGWLAREEGPDPLSLYLHIPFCDRLCWYCGCNTRQTLRYEPVAAYVEALLAEIALVARHLPGRRSVVAIHFGGGSPTILSTPDLVRLRNALAVHFDIDPAAEISVEIDPGYVDAMTLSAWADFGMTRASVGVQDFDPAVQTAINRPQTFQQTQQVVNLLREFGVGGINLDVVYGLPHQTVDSLSRTLDMALSMQPDRFAIFGYAHVPWMKKHQTLIDETTLAGAQERFDMQCQINTQLTAAGYLPVGIDHFARRGDSLAEALEERAVRRNFQGYTSDRASSLIGLGASAIGRIGGGYVQNQPTTGAYLRAVRQGQLPVAKGFALTDTDRAVGDAIEALMCFYWFSLRALEERYGQDADTVRSDAVRIHRQDQDGFIRFDGDRFEIVPEGQPVVRTIAAGFDQYFGRRLARHSIAV